MLPSLSLGPHRHVHLRPLKRGWTEGIKGEFAGGRVCFCFLLALLGARPLPPLTNVNNRWMRTHRASLVPTLVRWEVRRGLPHYELSLRVPSGSFMFVI